MVEPKAIEVPPFKLEEGKRIVFMLGGPDGKPLADHSYDVFVSDDDFLKGITSEEGLAKELLMDEGTDKVKFRWYDADNLEWEREYYLEKDDFDTEKGQTQRINNIFFAQPGLSFDEELAKINKCDVMGVEKYKKAIEQLVELAY